MGWDRTEGVLRAPMGPNDPKQPHLGPPSTASAPFKSSAGKAEGAFILLIFQSFLKLCLGVFPVFLDRLKCALGFLFLLLFLGVFSCLGAKEQEKPHVEGRSLQWIQVHWESL